MLCCMVWGTSGMTLNKDSKTSQPSFHQSKSPTRRGKTINNLNQDREDAPLRRGGDDFRHVKIILPPWIPCSTKPWLTTALRRSVHHESSLLAFSHTHTQGVFPSLCSLRVLFSSGLFSWKICCHWLFSLFLSFVFQGWNIGSSSSLHTMAQQIRFFR